MTTRIVLSVLIATLLTGVSTSAQSPGGQAPLAGRFVDPANGLSLEQAIARAIEQEPSLRAARSQVEVAQGTKSQASLRPNPSVSFERRDEPGGTDHLTTVGVEWPLDLFRRSERRRGRGPRSHGCAAVCVRSRAPAGSRGPHAIRRRPGDDSRSRALRRNRGRDTEPVRLAPVSRRTGSLTTARARPVGCRAPAGAGRPLAPGGPDRDRRVRVETRARHEGGCHAHRA